MAINLQKNKLLNQDYERSCRAKIKMVFDKIVAKNIFKEITDPVE